MVDLGEYIDTLNFREFQRKPRDRGTWWTSGMTFAWEKHILGDIRFNCNDIQYTTPIVEWIERILLDD